jgi:thiamine-monophosphate kinase
MRAGDRLFASGPLGLGGALAASVLFDLPPSLFAEGDYRPPARLAEGRLLRGIASACMDTSDGLLATLDQLVRLNGVRIRVAQPLERLLHPRAEAVRQALELPPFPFLAGHHGEFELVFSVPPADLERLREAAAGIGWTPLEIGRVEEGESLNLGDRWVDGARLRNLLDDVGGDLEAYLQGLLELGSDQRSD